MLNRLALTNVRRHAYTEIDFTGDAQLILLAGPNGVGKSTVLEGLNYAFYGETRHGRRHLGRMVRRGAEHEGMQVELSFTVGNVEYDIVRRWEKGVSSAVLRAGGKVVMNTADGVTREVTRILGMDSTGYKVAAVANQKQLDGLASLSDGPRRKTISRLMRMDAVSKAINSAQDEFNTERKVAAGIEAGVDADAAAATVETAETDLAEARAAEADARTALAELDADLAGSADVEKRYRDAAMALAAAEATVSAAAGEVSRLAAERASLVVPPQPASPEMGLTDAEVALSQIDVTITKGETMRQLAAQAAAVTSELDRTRARLAAVADALGGDTVEKLAKATSKRSADVEKLTAKRDALDAARTEALNEIGAIRGRVADLARRQEAAQLLGAMCDSCGQPITDEHKAAHQQGLAEETEQARLDERRVLEHGTALAASLAQVREQIAEAENEVAALTTRRVVVANLLSEQQEAKRREQTYVAQLARLDVVDIDLDVAYARKGQLECAKSAAQDYEAAIAARQSAVARLADLDQRYQQASDRAEQARAAAVKAAPDETLLASFERREQQLKARVDEAQLVDACATAVAVGEAKLEAARAALDDAEQASARVRAHKDAAAVASKTAQVLTEVSKRMATQIRPALEVELAQLLAQLSDGRFTSVRVADDYAITVCDRDGQFHPVSEFSGGESDLIALATRLALAQIVSRRHGVGGVGFLVLDECFGSQDDARRSAILEGLRRLRGVYGQILLISHVGGIEDAADRVVWVSADEDDASLAAVNAA